MSRLLRHLKAAFAAIRTLRRKPQLHLLPQNEDLAPADYPAVRALIEQVRILGLTASEYVAAHGHDPEVFLPGNIWAKLHDPSGSTDWRYDLVNYARAVSPFSGFQMMLWGRSDLPGDYDPDEAKRFYDDLFSGALTGRAIAARMEAMGIPRKIERSARDPWRFYRSRANLVSRYDELVAEVPRRFRIDAPKRGGEIGLIHDGRILNPDVLIYQSRINALYGSGTLQALERVIAERGSANYLEIGPGHCFFAYSLRRFFGGRLNVFLIDLPFVMANGLAYLSCVAGVDSIGLATQEAWPGAKPFVFLPSYLVPLHEQRLPRFHLVHNAISLNEMNAAQVAYYLDFIDRHLAEDGVFHLCGGEKILEYHEDVLGAAMGRLRLRQSYREWNVEGIPVLDPPNTFFGANLARSL